ncbi:MAG TPA: hypothetical protein V6D50_25490 [Chroococcales cyanobacterium]|jgi:hypothetical protein
MKSITPELINSLTPIFIATIGGIIGVTVLVTPSSKEDSAKGASAMGLAGTAIAGAAGLAQSGKSESTVSGQNSKLIVQNKEV